MKRRARTAGSTSDSEWRNGLDQSVGGGIAEARRQGEILVEKIWSGKDMLTTRDAALRLNVTPQAMYRLRQTGKVIGLTNKSTRSYRYPSWQFDKEIMTSVQQISQALSNYDGWGKYLFFVQIEPLLQGRVPLDLIRNGCETRVIRVARLLNANC